MALIFVAGPLSHPQHGMERQRVHRAMAAGIALFAKGHQPVVPHLTWFLDCEAREIGAEVPGYEQYMALSLAILRRCDGLLYLGPSPGADRELALAKELGLPVWERVEDVPATTEGV